MCGDKQEKSEVNKQFIYGAIYVINKKAYSRG